MMMVGGSRCRWMGGLFVLWTVWSVGTALEAPDQHTTQTNVEDSTTPRKEHVRRGRRLDDYLDHERPHIRTYDHTQIRTKQGNSASSAMEAEKAFPEQADTQLQGEVMGNMPIPTTSGGDTKNANSMNMMTPLNEDHKMGNSMMMEDNKMGNSMMNEDHKMGNSMMMEDNKMGNNMMMEDHKMGNNMMNEDHKMGHSMMMEDNKMGNNMMMNEEGKMGNGMHDEPFPEDGKHGNSMMMSGEDKMGNSMMMEDHKMGNHMVMSEEGKMGNSMMNDDSINMGNNMMNGDYHDDTHMKTANSMMNGDYRDETHMKTANSMMNGDYHDETHMKTANSMMNGDYHDDTHMKTANSMRNGDYHDDTHMKTANSMMMDSNHNEMKEGNYVGTPWNGNAKTTTTTGARTGATSASSSRGGWQMTAVNDGNYLGGSNYMAIADTSNGRMPFGIEENAPDYSMFVDAEGHVGLGTSYPSASLHIVGTSPAIKLETEDIYDETSWDVMATSRGLFFHETHNGQQRLPLIIRPGAQTMSMVLNEEGNVGVGTDSPDAKLHVKGNTIVEGTLKVGRQGSQCQFDTQRCQFVRVSGRRTLEKEDEDYSWDEQRVQALERETKETKQAMDKLTAQLAELQATATAKEDMLMERIQALEDLVTKLMATTKDE